MLLLFLTALLITDPQYVQAQKAEQTPDNHLTPLMHAAAAGRLDDVRNLLKARANVNETLRLFVPQNSQSKSLSDG